MKTLFFNYQNIKLSTILKDGVAGIAAIALACSPYKIPEEFVKDAENKKLEDAIAIKLKLIKELGSTQKTDGYGVLKEHDRVNIVTCAVNRSEFDAHHLAAAAGRGAIEAQTIEPLTGGFFHDYHEKEIKGVGTVVCVKTEALFGSRRLNP